MKNSLLPLAILVCLALELPAAEHRSRVIADVGPTTEEVELEKNYRTIHFVSIESASDDQGDGSKAKPWRTLTHALASINQTSESVKHAVLVAEGTYRSGTIVMKEFVDLFGGFSPTTWKRDIFRHRTVLDGERVRRVVVGANHARIDGFTILKGLGRTHGGGILCEDTSPTISNNFIVDNSVLEPEGFDHNRIHQPGHHGGGIACLYNAVPVIRNNLISSNSTSVGSGAGIAFYGWLRMPEISKRAIKANRLEGGLQPLVENNVILANTAGVNDLHRTRSSNGGAVSCAFEARPIIRNNVIAQNQAKGRGDGGGIYNEFYSDPLIEANWIVGNIADDDAGGIYTMRMGQPVIRQNVIAGNWAPGRGAGGIRLSKEGRARIVDNLIVRNLSGGGVQCSDSYLELEHNLILHNQGGNAVLFETRFSYFLPSVISNNTLRENENEPIAIPENHGQPLIVENNNVQGGFEGRGNHDAPPAFVNDSIKGKTASAQFDAFPFTTAIPLERPVANSERLGGRVIRVGNRWSVIKAAESRSLVVWGDLSTAPPNELHWEIVSNYETK